MSRSRSAVGWIFVIGLALAACGGDTIDATSSTQPGEATTTSESVSTTQVPATTTTAAPTTTTAPSTTTTTLAAIETSTVVEVFQSYFDEIAAKNYEGARGVSVEAANEYATFTEHFNVVSPQPDWQLESVSDPTCCEVVQVGDRLVGAEISLNYGEPNGSQLAVANPVVDASGASPVLVEWGVDLGSGIDQPPVRSRLKNLHPDFRFDPLGPDMCTSVPLWAYVPGGADISQVTPIIVLGTMCTDSHDLQPDPGLTKLYTDNGSVDVGPSTMLWTGGPAPIPKGTTGVFLMVFEIPSALVGEDLKVESQFERIGIAAWTIFEAAIGPFDLSK